MKKGQTFSLEAFGAVMVFLTAVVLFYTIALADSGSDAKKESEAIMERLSSNPILLDNKLDQYENNNLAGYDCEAMKEFLGTNKNAVIYFKDKDGNLVRLNNENAVYGCDEIINNP